MGLLILGGLVGIVFLVLLFWVIGMYNLLIRRRVDCDNAWSQIDVQLKRRYDLIPNLVETVKGYASHEREALEAVIAARSRAVAVPGGDVAQRAEAENMLTSAIGKLFALSEAYPQLKADANFRQLQEELTSTENKVGFSRQHFNDCVGRFEETRQTFPANMIAGAFNFTPRDYFKVEASAEREAPKVSFR
ncbi:MAG: LemA family protein [Phycisphaerales bacterium]|nr:LemA family protein [Phycisphaerales bacterium]